MTIGQGGFRHLIVGCIVVWPALGLAQPPQAGDAIESATLRVSPPLVAQRPDQTADASALRVAPFSFHRLAVGRRGLEYRSSLAIKRRVVPFRVWGGRKHKQPALGIEFEPPIRGKAVRAGAYGSQEAFGFAIRIRY